MRKILLALAVLIGAPLCMAQTIVAIVSGVVTADVGRSTTFKVNINQTISSVVFSSGSTPAAGQIVTVFFTENATGGFTVTFGGNIINPCSVTTTANATTTCVFSFDGTSNTWNGTSGAGGGGASGALADASIYISSSCGTATNCFAATPGNAFFDCTYATASPTLTCTASDNLAPFASGTWRVIVACCGAPGGQSHIGSALEAPAVTTVLSVNNGAHTITMNQNATATRATIVGQSITLVQDQTSIFQSAANSALTSGGHCAPLQIGAGIYGVRQGFANSATCKNAITNTATTGWGANGAGPGGRSGTIIVPLPDFDFSTCTGTNSSCFFGVQGAVISNLAIWGGENSTNANSSTCGTNSKTILDLTTDSLGDNILIAGWCANDTALRGIKMEAPGEFCFYCLVDGAGGLPFEIASSASVVLTHSFGGDSNGVNTGFGIAAGILVGTNAALKSNVSGFGVGGLNTFNIVLAAGSEWLSVEDICLEFGTVNNGCMTTNGGRADITGFTYPSNFGTTTNGGFQFGAAAEIHARNSVLAAGSAGFGINCNVGGTTGSFFDEGGNTWPSAGPTNCVAGHWFGSQSITGSNTVTGNWALTSGWGASTVASAAGDSHRAKVTITGAAGAANPVLTWTFPKAYIVAPTTCSLIENTTDIASLTSVASGTPTTTSVAFTFAGTPIAVTYSFDVGCGP